MSDIMSLIYHHYSPINERFATKIKVDLTVFKEKLEPNFSSYNFTHLEVWTWEETLITAIALTKLQNWPSGTTIQVEPIVLRPLRHLMVCFNIQQV